MEAATLPSILTEVVRWPVCMAQMSWRQGEHVTIIGPTGAGKTELTVKLVGLRPWTVFFGTKKQDETQDRLRGLGFRTIQTANELNAQIANRFILRPPFPRNVNAADLRAAHREAFRQGLMQAFAQTGWTVCIDEARYICEFLGLKDETMLLWLQGRSQKNSVLAATQRPRFVPLEAYDQATHLFFFRDPDLQNVARVSELAGFNRDRVIAAFQVMRRHDVLYVNTVTQQMYITNTRWE